MILSLNLMLFKPMITRADSYEEASKQAAKAAYVQSGLDQMINRYSKELERRYLPEFVVTHGGVLVFVTQTLVSEQIRISFKWEF